MEKIEKTAKVVCDNIIKDYKKNTPIHEISTKYSVTDGYIRVLLYNNGISRVGVRKVQRRAWSNNDIKYLKTHYGKHCMSDIIKQLGRPEISIRVKANMLGLYCDKHISNNQSIYTKIKYDAIVEIYNRIYQDYSTLKSIAEKISENIKVSPEGLTKILKRYKITARPTQFNLKYSKDWTYYEVKRLKELYKTKTARECSEILNRSFYAVTSKIQQQKLYK